jgi:hypothetical protein
VSRGELRRDKPGFRGSAACFTFTGGMGVPEPPPNAHMGVPEVTNGGAPDTPHQPNQSTPSGPPGPRAGRCRKHPDVERYKGECWRCEQEEYHATFGGGEA